MDVRRVPRQWELIMSTLGSTVCQRIKVDGYAHQESVSIDSLASSCILELDSRSQTLGMPWNSLHVLA